MVAATLGANTCTVAYESSLSNLRVNRKGPTYGRVMQKGPCPSRRMLDGLGSDSAFNVEA